MENPITGLPTLRQLSYLLALQEHQHFGRAAAACCITQSALSAALADLERILGAQLVERSKRGLRFTEAGEEVATRAREVVRSAGDLQDAARGVRERLAGPLRLAVIPTVAPFLLPRLMTTATVQWPRLRLFVREMLTGAACEALQRNAVDCVLLALPADCGEVEVCDVMVDRLLIAEPQDGRDGAAGAEAGTVDPGRLLLLDEGHCLRDQALAACNLTAASLKAPVVAATLQTLVGMVDAGLGVTFLPQMAVTAGMLRGARVRCRPIGGGAERRIALVWRKRSPREADLRLFGATIREAAAKAPDR